MVADPLDRAVLEQERALQIALANRSKYRELQPKGACHFCYEPLTPTMLFCDADCSHDYERDKRNK